MTASEIAGLVRELKPRFLEGLRDSDVNTILSAAKPRRFLPSSVILNQGHPASYLYMLLNGRARYFYMTPDGQKILLFWLQPGEMFGAAAMLHRISDYLVSTEAVKSTYTLAWERDAIRALALRHPRLLENALLIASDYLDATLALHVSLTRQTARQRVAQVLVTLASGIGHSVPGGVELTVNNEELASAANVTPFTASRLLSGWQRDGMLAKSRGKVVLRSPEKLLLHEV